MKVTVAGAGAWGTALACLLERNGNTVTLWGHDRERLEEVKRTGQNKRYLPGIELGRELSVQADLSTAIKGAECVVLAVPSKAFREVGSRLSGYKGLVVSVTKGLEYETGLTMCGILEEIAPASRFAGLSGPSFAIEVASGIPTAIVVASPNSAAALEAQTLFNTPTFRVYTSADLLGVELGGALKNVIAIAAGTGDGMKFGDNSKAALVTRSIVEIRRLGEACGAQGETFTGLSGLGDLMVTCFSRHSRNRAFGERIGRGEKPAHVAESMLTVAEGYPTARSAYRLARKLGVVTPVIDEVYAMLYENKDVRKSVMDLMSRDPKPED